MQVFSPAAELPIGPLSWREDALRPELTRALVHGEMAACLRTFLDLVRFDPSHPLHDIYEAAAVRTAADLAARLLTKRPLCFYGQKDKFTARSGATGTGLNALLEQEGAENYLTYDEIQLAAMLSISCFTPFVNAGGRFNSGEAATTPHVTEGVYVGCVGARFEKPGVMEHRYLAESFEPTSATEALIRSFLVGDSTQTLRLGPEYTLHLAGYRKRMRMTIEPFLEDAQRRGEQAGNRPVYVRIVGLGLGVWSPPGEGVNKKLAECMMEIYRLYIRQRCPLIQNVEFLWSPLAPASVPVVEESGGCQFRFNPSTVEHGGEPAAPLPESCRDHLLVAQFAWDGGAYVGNEFWDGKLTDSGDPAAVCCSALAALATPERNPAAFAPERMDVSGRCCRSTMRLPGGAAVARTTD